MDFQPLGRAADASQQPVRPWHVCAMCRWAFGPEAEVAAAVELGGGYYNTTYRVEVRGVGVVILRIAPPPGRQYRLERHLMRNEYASIPYLAPVADLLPPAAPAQTGPAGTSRHATAGNRTRHGGMYTGPRCACSSTDRALGYG